MNIVILTSVYPGNYKDETNSVTKVVHYFAKEWVEAGHDVLVFHNAHRYPYFVHALPQLVKKEFLKRHGYPILGLDYIKEASYVIDGVKVWRLPLLKLIPHSGNSKRSIKKQADKIHKILVEQAVKPDVIVGHFGSPQIQLLAYMKNYYDCPTALTMHDLTYVNNKNFDCKHYIDKIDSVGFRNKTDAKKAQAILKLKKDPYICYSGIPQEMIVDKGCIEYKFEDFQNELKVLFVGRLVERKHVDTVILALKNSNIKRYRFDIVGDGPIIDDLKHIAGDNTTERRVVFHGQIDREHIKAFYQNAHMFVTISHGEAYGLVYLEAMAAGCITIGSFNEGIDGIIENEKNGFLCHSGNEEELLAVFEQIKKTDLNIIKEISLRGWLTANEMTDKKMALNYLKIITRKV